MSNLTILYEDNHLLVINKPCGLATMGVTRQLPSAVRLAADYIKHKFHKPGNVYVGVVSRLDALASGILVLARTSKAASRISQQIRQHSTIKVYLAVVDGTMDISSGWTFSRIFVKKDEASQRMVAVEQRDPSAQQAELKYRCLAHHQNRSVVEVQLITGRKHQIRLQLASLGYPVAGDRKYGARQPWKPGSRKQGSSRKSFKSASPNDASGYGPTGIGLHCYQYSLQHPTKQVEMSFQAIPKHWRRYLDSDWYLQLADSQGWNG